MIKSEDGKRPIIAGSAIPNLVMFLDRDKKRAVPTELENPLPIILTDKTNMPLYLKIDESTGAIIEIDYAHHEVHEGRHFFWKGAQDVATSTTISFTIVTPDTTRISHFGFVINGEIEWDLLIYEGATGLTSAGTVVSNPGIFNNDRNSTNVNGMIINATPTLGAGSKGTLMWHGHGGSGRSLGGMAGTGEEIKLKRNTIYWIDVTNVSNSASNYFSWLAEWYEHIDL